MPVNTELVAALLVPIPGDNPSGADLRYDARIDAIKEARREELVLPGDAGVRKLADWSSVIASITPLLSKETKDLQLASWLSEALLHKQGYGGFATGLLACHGILERFWDTCYPELEDDDPGLRAGPLEWIGSKLAIPFRMTPFGSAAFSFLDYSASRAIPSEKEAERDDAKGKQRKEAVKLGKMLPEVVDAAIDGLNKVAVRAVLADLAAVRDALIALDKEADARFGRDAPSLVTMRSAVEEVQRFANMLLTQLLESDPDPIEVVEESAVDSAGLDPSAPLTPEPVSRADAAARLAVVAKWFRKEDPTNPAPYYLLRGYRWSELRTNAPELDPKLLEAPPTAIRARLKGLLLDGKWSELLEAGETLLATPQGRGWLDLQRYSTTACANLGGGYDAIATAIRHELRALLAAVPTLPEMTLMDDTPTANDETRKWLAEDALLPDPAAAEGAEPIADEGADVLADDGIETTAVALEHDNRTAVNGGLSKGRRPSARVLANDPFDLARSELQQGRPHRAIELLVAELSRERSPRAYFVRQTQIAYIMVEAGLDKVVRPILQRLIETINEKGLEQWESGPLVAQPLALMCRVIDRSDGDRTERQQMYLRVCRLDPLQALALQTN